MNYLKYIAEIYLEVLPNVKNYENGLKKLDRYILSQNVEKIREKFEFAEENKDPFYVYVTFQKIIKAWVTKSKDAKLEQAGELKIPVDQSNPAGVGESVATMFSLSGDELQTFKKEEAEIFTQILIEGCNEHIESKRQADLAKKVAIGIAGGALTIAGFQGIRTMNVKMPNLGSASNRDFTKKIITTGMGIAAVAAIGAVSAAFEDIVKVETSTSLLDFTSIFIQFSYSPFSYSLSLNQQ